MGLYQAVAAARKDLLVVCNGYQVCMVISSGREKKELLVVYNGYQVCAVIPSSSRGKDGSVGGL